MDFTPIPAAYVGLGERGDRYMRAAHWVGGFPPAALVDTDPERFVSARNFTSLDEDRCYGTLTEALDAQEIAAVFVCCPPAQHAAYILEALEAGKHVFTETPFTTDYADAVKAVELAETNGLTLMVGQQWRHRQIQRTIRQLLHQRAFGEIGFGIMTHYAAAPVPFPSAKHARLWEFDCHNIDSLLAMLPSEPVRVFGRSYQPGFSDAPSASTVQALIEFADGTTVQYLSSTDVPLPGYQWRLDCEAATLIHRGKHPGGGDANPEVVQVTPNGQEQPISLDATIKDKWVEETLAILFKDRIRGGAELETDGRNNLRTLAVLHAIVRSSETGKAIDIAEVAPQAVAQRS